MNGLTGVWFEGVPNYPGPDRLWEVTDKYKVCVHFFDSFTDFQSKTLVSLL